MYGSQGIIKSGGTGGGTGVDRFIEDGNTLELWYKSNLVQSWTVDGSGTQTGTPIGLLLALTHEP